MNAQKEQQTKMISPGGPDACVSSIAVIMATIAEKVSLQVDVTKEALSQKIVPDSHTCLYLLFATSDPSNYMHTAYIFYIYIPYIERYSLTE